jgi:hypothetical protein
VFCNDGRVVDKEEREMEDADENDMEATSESEESGVQLA